MQSASGVGLPPNKHQERSLRTRELLLDATIESLIELGYAKTSTSAISARAGLSRGAQLHQFRTKTELIGQTIEHLTAKQLDQLHAAAAALPADTEPAHAVVGLVWATFSGRLGRGAVVLFTAIVDDDELRERMLRMQRSLTVEALAICGRYAPPDSVPQHLETIFWLTLNLVRGLTVDEMLGRDPERRRQLVDAWKAIAETAYASGA